MQTSEKIFLGIAASAGVYLIVGWFVNSPAQISAQSAPQQLQTPVSTQPGQTRGHYMPNGEWMEEDTGGIGCGMMNGDGGGCGCAGMKTQPSLQ